MRLPKSSLLIVVLLTACTASPLIECGEPNMLVDHPRGIVVPGVRVGPLHVTTGMWDGQSSARLGWDRAEQLSKFIVTRVDAFDSPVHVSGRRCADGRALRFAEGQPWKVGASISPSEIERLTTPTLKIPPPLPPPHQSGADVGYGGYFIFTAPGRWLIEVTTPDRLLGKAVVEVIAPAAR